MPAIQNVRRFGELSLPAGQTITAGQLVIGAAGPLTRTVTDGATTNNSASITSSTAAFQQADVGDAVSGAGIPAGTVIVAVTSATAATLSNEATATGTGVSLTFTTVTNPDATTTDVAYVAGSAATNVLGVAVIDATPYSALQASPVAAFPAADRVTIGAHGEYPVTYAANATVGQKLLAAANGQVTPASAGPAADQVVGYCTESTSAGQVGRAYIGSC